MREHDDEVAWQQREITGSTVLLCEQCGLPLGPDDATLTEATSLLEGQRLCARCRTTIGRGDVEPDWDDDEAAQT